MDRKLGRFFAQAAAIEERASSKLVMAYKDRLDLLAVDIKAAHAQVVELLDCPAGLAKETVWAVAALVGLLRAADLLRVRMEGS